MTQSNYKYDRKPEPIEAFKWTGDINQGGGGEPEWIVEALKDGTAIITKDELGRLTMALSGNYTDAAKIGDYIWRDDDGELYAASAEDFERQYYPLSGKTLHLEVSVADNKIDRYRINRINDSDYGQKVILMEPCELYRCEQIAEAIERVLQAESRDWYMLECAKHNLLLVHSLPMANDIAVDLLAKISAAIPSANWEIFKAEALNAYVDIMQDGFDPTADDFTPIDTKWDGKDGKPQGIHSAGRVPCHAIGIGYTIVWQSGELDKGKRAFGGKLPPETSRRNGAFMIEVLESCLNRLEDFQDSKFASAENQHAIACLKRSIYYLNERKNRRQAEGTLGTHSLDKTTLVGSPDVALDIRPKTCTTNAELYEYLGRQHPNAKAYIWQDGKCHPIKISLQSVSDIDDNEEHQLSEHSPEYSDILVSGVNSYVLIEKA
jgi:hypothetical protein